MHGGLSWRSGQGPAMFRGYLFGSLACLASRAAVLDCSQLDPSEPLAVCCDAQSAWSSMESAGGCGGSGASSEQCSAASSLCQQCRMAVAVHAHADSDNSAAEGAQLSSLGIGFLEVQCALPRWQDSCHNSIADLGFGVLLVAGGVLMLLAIGGLMLFDWRVLPWLVSRGVMSGTLSASWRPHAAPEKVGQPQLERCNVGVADALRLAAAVPIETTPQKLGGS
ncbi:unnamed protein product [Symbiodinium sp. KB8]|nr:unnamed protein product [Symbiodinium sp. KB8]